MRRDRTIPYRLSDHVLSKYFGETGTRQGWLPEEGRTIGVAVSGGGDSIALLWLCRKFYHGTVAALHVNHGIRGSASDGDMDFTSELAAGLGVEFHASRVRVPDERTKGESLESAARRVRHRELVIMAKTVGVDSILTGHNRDDLAETVLFNLLRGTGIRGIVGITESNEIDGVTFYRPLLGLRREFLREILRVRGITWREDSTNDEDSYTRNFIRLKLLPMVSERINSSAVEHLASFGEDMRAARTREDELSMNLFRECIESDVPAVPVREGAPAGEDVSVGVDSEYIESDVIMNRKKLRALSPENISLVIREAGRRLGLRTLSRDRCTELSRLIVKTDSFIFQWSGGIRVKGVKGKIYIEGMNR